MTPSQNISRQSRSASLWMAFLAERTSENKNRLALWYADLVRISARRFRSERSSEERVIELQDLEQAAFLGLYDAIERFDPDRGVTFETFASARIRGAMQDQLRSVDWVPRSVRQDLRAARVAGDDGEEQPRERMNDTPVRPTMKRIVSDIDADRAGSPSEEMVIADDAHTNDSIDRDEQRQKLVDLVEALDHRDRLVITLYYFEELTFKEIATILRVSESRISQIHGDIVTRFRNEMKEYA